MMFASKTPRDIYPEPEPTGDYWWDQRLSDAMHAQAFEFFQHNEPNPILVDVRKYRAERLKMNNPKGWTHVLRRFEHADKTNHTNMWTNDVAHIDHARRVLERLARWEAAQ